MRNHILTSGFIILLNIASSVRGLVIIDLRKRSNNNLKVSCVNCLEQNSFLFDNRLNTHRIHVSYSMAQIDE